MVHRSSQKGLTKSALAKCFENTLLGLRKNQMGEREQKQPLTWQDIVSVFIYRLGIVLCCLSMTYLLTFFYYENWKTTIPAFLNKGLATALFWVFCVSVSISVSFLHLYSKKILKIIRLMAYSGLAMVILLQFTNYLNFSDIINSLGLKGKLGILGTGLVLAGFSGIGAKEAFCFRLYEGYAFGIGLGILALLQLIGVLPLTVAFILFALDWLLIFIFTARKLTLPLHYDIGDKSRY